MMKANVTAVLCTGLVLAAGAGMVSVAHAQGVVGEWSQVQAPPAPQLHRVSVNPANTALLLMDFGANCSREPRCKADLPHIRKLLDQARSHGMLVVYSAFRPGMTMASAIEPRAGEPIVVGRGNRFYHTDLDALLKRHGIHTIIACGTVANGVELFTAAGATGRGYHVIVPVDCMPARSAYAEQTVVWNLANDPEFAPPRAFAGRRVGAPAAGRRRSGAATAGRARRSGPPPGYATLTSVDRVQFG